jgi:hypothetical protein
MSESPKPEDSIEISGKLDVSKYIYDVPVQTGSSKAITKIGDRASVDIPLIRDLPPQPKIRRDLEAWVSPKRAGARSGITVTLIVFFGVSLLVEFLLIGLGAFYPQANVALIKDTLPLMINSLTSILFLALAFDFKDK